MWKFTSISINNLKSFKNLKTLIIFGLNLKETHSYYLKFKKVAVLQYINKTNKLYFGIKFKEFKYIQKLFIPIHIVLKNN